MGRKDLSGIKLLFPHCRSVHTWFMRVPIDLAFVDASRRVVKVFHGVMPWRFVRGGPGSDAVVEMQAGSIRSLEIKIGDKLEWQ